jgi:hypothetical protein
LDWPAFKCSKLKTVKSFKENYKYISINDEKGRMKFSIEYPSKNKYGDGRKIFEIKNSAKNCDIGKKIKEIYSMSEKDIKIILGDT